MSEGIIFLVILVIYFIPTIIAAHRNTLNQSAVFVINLFLGWTFLGWVIALAMSVNKEVRVEK